MQEQLKKIREEAENCKRPMFFFHDDADGVCSFLQFYKFIGKGKGIVIKSTPNVDERFLRQVEEYSPDKIFILDLAMVKQEFLDAVNAKVIWIDHHEPQKRDNVLYFNPRLYHPNENTCVSHISYKILKQHLWIAMTGTVGDWQLPKDLAKEFSEKYPDLLPKNIKSPDKALFGTRLGELIKIINISLKGKTNDAMNCIKIMTRIDSPYELLNADSPQTRFIHKKIHPAYEEYSHLISDVVKHVKNRKDKRLIVYTYQSKLNSYTGELSNELLFRYPKSVIIIAREKSGEMKMSLRSGKNIMIRPILEKALACVNGYGGGHEHACGGSVKVEDWENFLSMIDNDVKASIPKPAKKIHHKPISKDTVPKDAIKPVHKITQGE